MPRADLNPIYPLAVALQRIGALTFPSRVLPATRPGIAALAELEKPPLSDALRRTAQAGAVSPEDDAGLLKDRSEEHTSELQSPCNLVCRLLLEKKTTIHVQPAACTTIP